MDCQFEQTYDIACIIGNMHLQRLEMSQFTDWSTELTNFLDVSCW